MIYNYYFEIAAILIMSIVLYDYNSKMKIFRLDSMLFKYVIYISLLESVVNFLSSVLITYTESVPVELNVFVATLFFVLQSTKIYLLASFACTYINPQFSIKSPGFFCITGLYTANLVLSLSTPFSGFFFRFTEEGRYVQGYGADWGYYFYLVNVLFCMIYLTRFHKQCQRGDKKAAYFVAFSICLGVVLQFYFRSTLMIGFFIALGVLYLFMTLENPNDYRDKLTALANEYAFKLFIDRKCEQKKIFTVMFLDIEKFHYINSIYGIAAGDYVLRKVSDYLSELLHGHVLFRVHNDLFAIAFNGPQDLVTDYVEQMTRRFEQTWALQDGREIQVHAAVVVCEYPRSFVSHTELVNIRTHMLKTAKENHDQAALFSANQITEKCRRQQAVEEILRLALQNGTLEVYYQPIIDSSTGSVVYLEALSRLYDEKLGYIPPDEFIAIAESTGQIITLGFYVFEKVCCFIEEKLLKLEHNTVRSIHVNLSSIQCAYPALKNRFGTIQQRHHIEAGMIHMELTESTMLESPELVRKTMEELIDCGVHFSLDDYGTGYSNISYLIQFPFDKIKFDKHMVWSYFTSSQAKTIMQKEFDLLHLLRKDIILEGIETKEQYEEMKARGIHLFQGFYFAKALPEEECIAYIRSEKKY